jgi:predicted transcriptional regulator
MKTTIELPDETFRKAKVLAAERRTTLKEVVTEALDRFLESSGGNTEKTRKANLKRLLADMQAANIEPMVPLSREEAHDR